MAETNLKPQTTNQKFGHLYVAMRLPSAMRGENCEKLAHDGIDPIPIRCVESHTI